MNFAMNPYENDGGGVFPRGTVPSIYRDGILWGGKVHDSISPMLRVGGVTYNVGIQSGVIFPDGIPESLSSSSIRVYRIRKDWQIADLRQDAAEINLIPTSAVTNEQIAQVRLQYEKDWNEWPWQKGAPFYDANHNGIKESFEEPGIANATQVVWLVGNDLDSNK